jgi:hypothetical protein
LSIEHKFQAKFGTNRLVKENGEEMRMGPLPDSDDFSAGRFAPLLKERVWD